jgi:hypothetical protein
VRAPHRIPRCSNRSFRCSGRPALGAAAAGSGSSVAETGDYLVSITVGGNTMSQVLRVEKRAGAGGGTGFFEEP